MTVFMQPVVDVATQIKQQMDGGKMCHELPNIIVMYEDVESACEKYNRSTDGSAVQWGWYAAAHKLMSAFMIIVSDSRYADLIEDKHDAYMNLFAEKTKFGMFMVAKELGGKPQLVGGGIVIDGEHMDMKAWKRIGQLHPSLSRYTGQEFKGERTKMFATPSMARQFAE